MMMQYSGYGLFCRNWKSKGILFCLRQHVQTTMAAAAVCADVNCTHNGMHDSEDW
jgi:hypothetical protein